MAEQEKIIGIMGGMGPEATVDLFQDIIAETDAESDQDHHRILIYNNPKVPDRTTAILQGGEDPLPELIKTAQLLENAGANFLVIPCNTAHYFITDLRQEVEIEIVSMITEVAKKIEADPELKKVGIMGTKGVIETGIYADELKEFGVDVVEPTEEQKDKLMEVIYAIKSSVETKKMQTDLTEIALSLIKRGADAVILGCTELPLLFDRDNFAYPLFVPQEILAKSAVKKIEK